ncbi:MAG: twin-arginine translocation signal domain-containing protein [Anaerolineaceae bacterium]|nr:twin-arginine translocation signal domain-containing protein [Anaerolineaceae bacterium]
MNEININNQIEDNPIGKTTRRGFLKALAFTAGGLTVLCSGLGIAGVSQPKIDYYSKLSSNEDTPDNKILLAYGSVCGSTGEVAKAISEELISAGLSVDVLPVQDVKTLTGYQTLILGSAIRMGQLCAKTRQFVDKFNNDIAQMQTAYFINCLTMVEDTPENRAEAEGYLAPLCEIKQPLLKGMFAGNLDFSKVELGLRLTMSKSDIFPAEGDYRDWKIIGSWGQEITNTLLTI